MGRHELEKKKKIWIRLPKLAAYDSKQSFFANPRKVFAMKTHLLSLSFLLAVLVLAPSTHCLAVHTPRQAIGQLLQVRKGDSWQTRILKKKMRRKLAKASAQAAPTANKNGLWSTLLGGIALLFTLLLGITEAGIFFVLTLAVVLVGIGLGIRGLSRDSRTALSIIGLILNGVVFAFYLYVTFLVIALFATCGG